MVGFLAEVQPDNWREPLGRLLRGDFWLEERMLLDVAVAHGAESARWPSAILYRALNDVRGQPRRPGPAHYSRGVGRPQPPDQLPRRWNHRGHAYWLYWLRPGRRSDRFCRLN